MISTRFSLYASLVWIERQSSKSRIEKNNNCILIEDVETNWIYKQFRTKIALATKKQIQWNGSYYSFPFQIKVKIMRIVEDKTLKNIWINTEG